MPLLTTAISGSLPDIAEIDNKNLFARCASLIGP
jgi:hypothetical protein